MQKIFQSKYLIVINKNTYVSIYKYEKYKFDQPFLSFQPKNIFIGESKVGLMTEFSGAADNISGFDRNTLLLEVEIIEYIYISGIEFFEIITNDKIMD